MNAPRTPDPAGLRWWQRRHGMAFGLWMLLIGVSLGFNLWYVSQHAVQYAREAAHANIDKDIAFRKWGSSHGGVYVPPTAHTPPNSWLQVPRRDVTTTDGQALTLMNPSYMLRQMQQDFPGEYGIRSRITSLRPLNPANAPDAWEREALLAFEAGQRKEIEAVADIDGVPHLRQLRPFLVEESCLKCHARQGYEIGDVRGGIGSNVSLQPYYADQRHQILLLGGTHGGLWLIGVVGIVLVRRSERRHEERLRAETDRLRDSERRQTGLARELERHRGNLENMVAERTAELESARREAERLGRVKGEFLANMSHEIRTPLNAVLGFAQVGRKGSQGRRTQQYFDQILDAGELLLGIINDILDYSKMEAGKLAVEQVPFDVGLLLERVETLVAPRAREKGLAWRMECAPDVPSGCLGDSLRLTQILVNLLSNAVKFTAQGEVSLSVRCTGGKLDFTVADTGPGIDATHLARLFAPFEQADSSTTRRFGGTGLGLVISRRLAELMDGDIAVTSTPGQGSRFTLRLPSTAVAPPPRAATAGPAGGRLAGLAVLVAEDIEANRLVLAELLADEQPRLDFVENGRAAVERVAAAPGRYDAVLMDIQMPEMDGYEAARRIGALAPDLPVIGLTAHALPEEHEKILAAGMVAHVAKPVQVDELVAVVLRVTRPRVASVMAAEAAGVAPGPSAAPDDAVPPAPTFAAAAAGGSIDRALLERRFPGKPAFVARLLATARAGKLDMPQRLRDAVAAADWPQAAFLAHAMKGVAGNICANGVAALAGQAEAAARAAPQGEGDDQAAAASLLLRLAGAVEALLEEIAAHPVPDGGTMNVP